MTDRSSRRTLAGVVGSVVALGTVGCLGATLFAGAALAGTGGYLASGNYVLALALVHLAFLGGVLLYRRGRSTEKASDTAS